MTDHIAETDALDYTDDWDDEPVCEHPAAAVISDVSGDHFCARCNDTWWEDPL